MKRAGWLIAAISLSMFIMVECAQAQTRDEGGSKAGAAAGTRATNEAQPGRWEGRSGSPGGYWDRYGGSSFPGYRWGYGRPYYGDWYGWNYSQPYFYGDAGYGASVYYGSAANQMDESKARLLVIVPPDARVFVEDQPTQQMGFERLFLSPSLEKGTYTYTVRATWTENGQEVNREKKVKVEPGRMASANFVAGGDERRAGRGRTAEYGSGEAEQRGDQQRNAEQQDRQTPGTDRNQPQDLRGQAGQQTREDQSKLVAGNIVRVEDDRIIVSLNFGEQRTFKVGADTRFIGMDGQKTDLRSLKPGMHVSIKPSPDSPTIANEIEVKQGPPAGDRQNQEKPAPQK
jgi:uncharacterized protein (TIGR03000 family)